MNNPVSGEKHRDLYCIVSQKIQGGSSRRLQGMCKSAWLQCRLTIHLPQMLLGFYCFWFFVRRWKDDNLPRNLRVCQVGNLTQPCLKRVTSREPNPNIIAPPKSHLLEPCSVFYYATCPSNCFKVANFETCHVTEVCLF